MHCDSMLESYRKNKNIYELSGHINVEKLKKGDCLAQCFALFIAQKKEARMCSISLAPYELFHALLDCFKENMRLAEADIRQTVNKSELLSNDRMSAILTVEDGSFVEGKYERIDEMADAGVKMLALTWNYENCFGYPNSTDPKAHSLGLKPFGKDALSYMNEKGILVDVSHLSEGGFWDVVQNSKASHEPFVASHSCCRSICSHQRNLTDEQLKALADCGGVVGVNFYSSFLKDNKEVSEISDIVFHLKHMKNIAGVDSLGFGSDFDGINCELEYESYEGFPKILNALEGTFTDDEIDKICSKNFLRIFK